MSEAETFTFTCSDGTAYQIPVEADGISFNVNNGSTYFGGVEASLVMADSTRMPEEFDRFCIVRPPVPDFDNDYNFGKDSIKSYLDTRSGFAIGKDHCNVCGVGDTICVRADNSGDEYGPVSICTDCIVIEVAKYHARQ